jgi:triphosphatase
VAASQEHPITSMREIELKFQVPAAQREALKRRVATAGAGKQRLQAQYFDTPDRALAAAGIALRLRREGMRWVQTLKAADLHAVNRLEHNVPLAGPSGRAATPPALDPLRHRASPAGERLAQVLAAAPGPLAPLFVTDIRRTARRVRSGGATIEVAFDEGVIMAGSRRLAVCEIEFELVSGRIEGLWPLARQWALRHGLWLDVRSKAERGDRLARGVEVAPAAKAAPAQPLPADAGRDAALRSMVGQAVQHALANAADIADERFTAEHVHQARVAMRRLRSLLRELGQAGSDKHPVWSTAVNPHWERSLAECFSRLGSIRDRDVLVARWSPRFAASGVPAIEWPAPADAVPPGAVLREPALQTLWTELLGFALGQPEIADPADERVGRAAAAVLERQWRKLRPAARRFGELQDDDRHRLRKRMKRLRYVADFFAPQFPPKRVQAFMRALRLAQEALGDYNDASVARALFASEAAAQPAAWFGIGWITAQHAQLVRRCDKSARKLLEVPRFWRAN